MCAALLLGACSSTSMSAASQQPALTSNDTTNFKPPAKEWLSYGQGLYGSHRRLGGSLISLHVTLTTTNDGWASFNVSQNPNNPSTMRLTTPPMHGSVGFGTQGDFLVVGYRPNPTFVGPDHFNVIVSKPGGTTFTVPTQVVVTASDHFVLNTEPPPGTIKSGATFLVADGSCPTGQIKQIIGGNGGMHIPRRSQCIPYL